jgi:hypothetical protein
MPRKNTRLSVADPATRDRIQKVRVMIAALKRQLDRPGARATKMAFKEIYIDADLRHLAKLENPKAAMIILTSAMVQKAAAAANIATKSELVECANAGASLTMDLAMAAALAPETLGLGSLVPLAVAAMDAYDFGKSCFIVEGQPAHAVRAARR